MDNLNDTIRHIGGNIPHKIAKNITGDVPQETYSYGEAIGIGSMFLVGVVVATAACCTVGFIASKCGRSICRRFFRNNDRSGENDSPVEEVRYNVSREGIRFSIDTEETGD